MPILSNFPTGGRGPAGETGGYYIPAVDAEGNITFTPSKGGMPEIEGGNVKGSDATINGVNALTIEGGDKVTATQDGSTLRLDTPNGVQVAGGGTVTMGDTIGAGSYDIEMTEEEEGEIAALQVGYNNLTSGMEATNVQDALNELMAGKIAVEEKGAPNGVAALDAEGKVVSDQLPAMDYIPNAEKGAAGGVASLDDTGKVTSSQLPAMDYIPNDEKGASGGVASLDSSGKVPSSQLPDMVSSESGIWQSDIHEISMQAGVVPGNGIVEFWCPFDEIPMVLVWSGSTMYAAQNITPFGFTGEPNANFFAVRFTGRDKTI